MPSEVEPDKQSGTSSARTETVAGFSIRDTASSDDKLGFKPYIEAVAAFLTNEGTVPPLTMSIEGDWGSGKSSFMLMLEGAIREHYKQFGRQAKVVSFNAWRYDKDEALWAAFALLLTNSLAKLLPFWQRMRAHCVLRVQRFDWQKGWFSVAKFTGLLLLLLVAIILPGIHILRNHKNIQLLGDLDEHFPKLLVSVAGGAGYLILIVMLTKKVVDAVGNPFAIDLKKFSDTLNYEERISFIERFHTDFAKILRVYAEGQTVFVFIDDLDRCELPKAADMMQGINLLMSDTCKAVYILGLDRDKIAAGLAAKYEKLFMYLNDQRTVTAGAPNTTTQSGLDFGFDFLEKFIQIPYQIPRPTNTDIARLFSSTGDKGGTPPLAENVDPGILFEIKVDSPLVQSIIAMVAPSFDHNPRRMKQFVNCFRLAAITASQTGLFGAPSSDDYSPLTAEQLGKMVAICLRWPLLIGDAVQDRSLLQRLEEYAVEEKEQPPSTKKQPHQTSRPSGIIAYWICKGRLLALLKYRVKGPSGSNYSLARLDLERYLRVSPALSTRRNDDPTSNPERAQSISINFGEPKEPSVSGFAPIAQSEARNSPVEEQRTVRGGIMSQATPSFSGDSQPAAQRVRPNQAATPTGIRFSRSAVPSPRETTDASEAPEDSDPQAE